MAGTAALGLSRRLRTRPIRNRPRTLRWGQVEHTPVATSSTCVEPPRLAHSLTCDLASHRSPIPTGSPTWTSAATTGSAASSTSTNMPPELHGRNFRQAQGSIAACASRGAVRDLRQSHPVDFRSLRINWSFSCLPPTALDRTTCWSPTPPHVWSPATARSRRVASAQVDLGHEQSAGGQDSRLSTRGTVGRMYLRDDSECLPPRGRARQRLRR